MHILHFYKTCFPDTIGGAQKVIDELATNTTATGLQNTVLALSTKSEVTSHIINGYQVCLIPQCFEIASTPFSWQVLKYFKEFVQKADIIHYHFPWPFADMVHLLANTKKPTVLTYHSDIVKQQYLYKLYQPLMYYFLKKVDKIVATSPNYVQSSKVLSSFIDKTTVIPLGLDKKHYPIPTKETIEYWKGRFPNRFFLFTGVLRYYKGLNFLIEAAKYVKAPILIVGSGKIENDLKSLSNTLGISNVYFLGQLSEEDKTALLTLCYAFIFPSHLRSEAFGLSLLEAAMFGKPMISCEIGTGTSYINHINHTGYVIAPADSLALAHAMQFFLDHPDQVELMGKNAFNRYNTLFTAEKMSMEYIKLYKKLLSIT
ncbi:Glycogen synthase [Rickettsiales bacterium Ac37b]|nr:Glycogen synthase [Rickettsiales bacterium Ac37b]